MTNPTFTIVGGTLEQRNKLREAVKAIPELNFLSEERRELRYLLTGLTDGQKSLARIHKDKIVKAAGLEDCQVQFAFDTMPKNWTLRDDNPHV